jgi:hypothetical protein
LKTTKGGLREILEVLREMDRLISRNLNYLRDGFPGNPVKLSLGIRETEYGFIAEG